MWYLWRAGPGDRVGQYLSQFPSLGAVLRVVQDVAAESGKKLVRRDVQDGVQFVVKEHATTLEALARSVVYYAKQDKKAPVIKEMEVAIRQRPLQPGDRLPSPHIKL